jgi:DNA mismatch repair protein MutS
LGNRALEQLDVTNKNSDTNLFDIINFTKTTIGKRFLGLQLTMPLINPSDINVRYNNIQKVYEGKHMDKIISFLEDIYDLDKLIRKLEINYIKSTCRFIKLID